MIIKTCGSSRVSVVDEGLGELFKFDFCIHCSYSNKNRRKITVFLSFKARFYPKECRYNESTAISL